MGQGVSPFTRVVTERLRALVQGRTGQSQLEQALRLLAKWRSQMLANTLRKQSGTTILGGPFKGMDYAVAAAEGAWATRLLGVYEASLAPVLETVIARRYPQIFDIGCAEGYYAVGLARRMPETQVFARDINVKARDLVMALAAANGVADRVHVGGEMDPAEFDLCKNAPTFVLCDIEGAEDALLDPVTAPGLLCADILVEVHDSEKPGLSDRIATRFAATHKITRIGRKLDDSSLPDWAERLSDLDRLLMLWEWRSGPTPWLWLECKERLS